MPVSGQFLSPRARSLAKRRAQAATRNDGLGLGDALSLVKRLGKRLIDRPLVSEEGLGADIKAGARGAYADTAGPFVEFAKDPSLLGGVGAAVALPTAGRTGMFARLMNAANEPQLVGPAKMHSELLQSLPAFTGKARKGRAYRVDQPSRPNADAYPEELDRIIAVQDPKTGTMFFAGGGLHHQELENQLRRIRSDGWIQHEVFPESAELGVPARMNQQVYNKDFWQGLGMGGGRDTRAATIARMRLLRQLRKQGINPAPAAQNLGRW